MEIEEEDIIDDTEFQWDSKIKKDKKAADEECT